MTGESTSRWNAATGFASLLAGVTAVVFERGSVHPTDTPAAITAYYVDNRDPLLAQAGLFWLGSLFLVWFVATLADDLRRREPGSHTASVAVLGAGVAAVVLNVVAVSFQAGLALAGPASGQPALVGIMNALFVVAGIPLAGMLVAVAVAGASTRSLPGWLLWLSGGAALAQLVPAAGIAASSGPLSSGGWLSAYLPYPLYAVWLFAVTVVLLRRPVVREPEAAPPGVYVPARGSRTGAGR